eukprot:8365753-Pyramimonas_sp.AAC.1
MRRRVGGRHVQHRGANPPPGFESLWARGASEDPVELLDVLPVSFGVQHEGERPGAITGEVFTYGSLL